MLQALIRPSRSPHLSQLDLRLRRYLPEGVSFQPTNWQNCLFSRDPWQTSSSLPSHQTSGSTLQEVYEDRTRSFRQWRGPSPLFLTTIRPHNLVSSSTIAQWLKGLLGKAGIDISIFKAHSVLRPQQPLMQESPHVTWARPHSKSETAKSGDWSSSSSSNLWGLEI